MSGVKVHVFVLTGRFLFGVIAMVLGVLWTLDNLGVMDSDVVLRWWPIALMAFGAVRLLGLDGHRHVTVGVIALIAGTWLLGEALGLVQVSVWRMWPAALVIVGLAMVSRAMRGQSDGDGTPVDDAERLNVFAFWSGVGRKPASPNFRGGEITAIMGGSEIDLASAGTPPDGATLDLFVWMGGVEITVPKNWRVINELTAVMGGVEDSREAPSHETDHTVRLRGLVIMGGVEIKG